MAKKKFDFEKKLFSLFYPSNKPGGTTFSDLLQCKLPSGRVFTYRLSDYMIRPDMSELEARRIALSIADEKYRFCEWDRNHPECDSKEDIVEALTDAILYITKKMPGPERSSVRGSA